MITLNDGAKAVGNITSLESDSLEIKYPSNYGEVVVGYAIGQIETAYIAQGTRDWEIVFYIAFGLAVAIAAIAEISGL